MQEVPKHQVPVVVGENEVVEALESGLVPFVSDTIWLPSRSLLEAEHDEGLAASGPQV